MKRRKSRNPVQNIYLIKGYYFDNIWDIAGDDYGELADDNIRSIVRRKTSDVNHLTISTMRAKNRKR